MTVDSNDVLARLERGRDQAVAELCDFLRIPSISTDPAYAKDVDRAADWLLERFAAAGFATEKIATDRHPLVYAEWTGAGPDRPTVLVYGHYDVQPPDPLDLWRNPPFEPTIEGGLLVARGATDDKGQSYAHVVAVAAMLAERGKLPVNVKFLIEGEEESGGASIDAYVRADGGKKLGCDCVLVSDTSMWAAGEPALTYGLKGLAYFEIRVQGPNRDLHSGVFGGGVENPGNAIATIVASLRDPKSGRILVDGFYDDVRPLADWEREEFKALGWNEEETRADLEVAALAGEEGYSYIERTWARPTCDVNGLWSGYQG
ncbi:MAG: M20/M25/M40 family metallo-hydrolase, partial [Acidobacteria bacterium]|nr:M20/M25/M40 family metallo-hydrolase [Acidobacteriota bacterium]